MTNMGIILPADGYHQALREATRATGTLLIIDETHTLSAGPGGCTAAWGLDPDLVTIGKAIGGGIACGALGLSDETYAAMRAEPEADYEDTGGVGGTLAGNALSLAAMRATLAHVLTADAYARTIPLAGRFAAGVRDVIAAAGLGWHVTQLGCRAEYRFQPGPPGNGTEASAASDAGLERYFHLHAMNRGVLITPFHNMALMSPVTTQADVSVAAPPSSARRSRTSWPAAYPGCAGGTGYNRAGAPPGPGAQGCLPGRPPGRRSGGSGWVSGPSNRARTARATGWMRAPAGSAAAPGKAARTPAQACCPAGRADRRPGRGPGPPAGEPVPSAAAAADELRRGPGHVQQLDQVQRGLGGEQPPGFGVPLFRTADQGPPLHGGAAEPDVGLGIPGRQHRLDVPQRGLVAVREFRLGRSVGVPPDLGPDQPAPVIPAHPGAFGQGPYHPQAPAVFAELVAAELIDAEGAGAEGADAEAHRG